MSDTRVPDRDQPLPAPTIELWPCQTTPDDLWFSEQRDEIDKAAQLCRTCPNQQPCYDGAVRRREAAGVWGGRRFAGTGRPALTVTGRPRTATAA